MFSLLSILLFSTFLLSNINIYEQKNFLLYQNNNKLESESNVFINDMNTISSNPESEFNDNIINYNP